MIEMALKTIVTVIFIVIGLTARGIQNLLSLGSQLVGQAKDATPGTLAMLKEQAGVASIAGTGLADKYVGALRDKISENRKAA